jgi:hypothetical protein
MTSGFKMSPLPMLALSSGLMLTSRAIARQCNRRKRHDYTR